MTNFENWLAEKANKLLERREKFKLFCTRYNKCEGCPLNDDKADCDIYKFEEWANREVKK